MVLYSDGWEEGEICFQYGKQNIHLFALIIKSSWKCARGTFSFVVCQVGNELMDL